MRFGALLSPGFLKLFAGLLCYMLNLNLLGLVPYYLELRGADELLYGTAAGMLGLGGVAAMLLLGGQADRVSRRRSVLRYMAVACAGNLLAMAAMRWSPAWYVLATTCHGVMTGVGLPVVFVWASELSPPERRTETFAWIGIAGLASDSLGPLLGESLLLTQAHPTSPGAYGIVFLAANLLWPLGLAFFLWAPDVQAPAGKNARQGLMTLLHVPALRLALLGTVAFGGALGIMTNLGKNFVASIGLGFVSVLLGGHTVGAVLARLALPWLTARVSRGHLAPLAFCGVALSLGLLAVTEGYGLLAVAGLVYGVSHGILFPTLLARLIDYGGTHAAGRISTLYMGVFSLGLGLLPTAGGVVLRLEGFPTLFGLVALACVSGAALQWHTERRHALRRPALS